MSPRKANSSQKEQAEFISNVNELQKKYQVVVSSPSLSTGVDISSPHFDKVFLFADCYASTAGDLLQASARVRQVKEVNFWVAARKQGEETDWEAIMKIKERVAFGLLPKAVREKLGADIWAWGFDPASGEIKATDSGYLKMFCQMKALENTSLNDLHGSFVEKAKTEGKVVTVKLTKEETKQSEEIKETTKAIRKGIKEQKQSAILNAVDLDPQMYEVLRKVEGLSEEEALSVKKYKLINLVGGLTDLLPQIVKDEKRFFNATYYQGLLSRDPEELIKEDEKDKVNKLPSDRKYRLKTVDLLKTFLYSIGFEAALEGQRLNVTNIDWVVTNKNEFSELLGVKVPSDVREKPMQFVQTVLGLLGLKATDKQRRLNGERVRDYYIDQNSVKLIKRVMEARELMFTRLKEEERAEAAAIFGL